MGIAQRIESTVEGWQAKWKDRLRGWMASWLVKGLNSMVDEVEPGLSLSVEDTLLKIGDDPNAPESLKNLIKKITAPGHPLPMLLIIPLAILFLIPTITSIFRPIGTLWEYKQERVTKTARFDPILAITAWRRDPVKYATIFEDLKDQGWSDDAIETLKFITLFIPSAQDQVTWLAREVFEPDMIERYGLEDELPVYENTDFAKIGVDPTQMANYWKAHWEHASFMQVIEMLHRGTLSLSKQMPNPPTTKEGWAARDAEGDKALYDWYRLVEIPPFWRARLTAMSWNVPTRVDVRRWWDMRTIDEERLRSIYHAQGYHGKDLEDYLLWTKVYVDFPDLMTRYKNGWLSLDDVRAELLKLGMSAERVEVLIQTKVKAVASEKMAKERDLTMSQIVKGVKKAVISRDEGALLLQDMGYDPYEANYILAIEIPQDEVVTEVKVRELTKADILSGLKTGIISEPEAMTRLLQLRYTPSDAEFLLNIYRAQVKPPTEPKAKEASKADILLGVKKGLISETEGYLMLLDLDFSPEAAEFILMVKAEESPFSPMSFIEFKELTQGWRRTAGMEGKPVNEEIRKAAAEVIQLTGERDSLQRSIKDEERKLIGEEILPAEATARLNKLKASLRKAESALSAAKTEYNRLVAEGKFA